MSAVVVISSLLDLGTIRRQEDPILKTQTAPILFKQKEEEMKDGPKGAPTPSFNLYPKAGFMGDPAVGKAKEELPAADVSSKESISEVVPAQDEESEEWWSDEKKDDSAASAKTSNDVEAKEES